MSDKPPNSFSAMFSRTAESIGDVKSKEEIAKAAHAKKLADAEAMWRTIITDVILPIAVEANTEVASLGGAIECSKITNGNGVKIQAIFKSLNRSGGVYTLAKTHEDYVMLTRNLYYDGAWHDDNNLHRFKDLTVQKVTPEVVKAIIMEAIASADPKFKRY